MPPRTCMAVLSILPSWSAALAQIWLKPGPVQVYDSPMTTMPLLTINHKTEYRYAYPVAFGEHRIMLRPRDGHDLRVLSAKLDITPKPEDATNHP